MADIVKIALWLDGGGAFYPKRYAPCSVIPMPYTHACDKPDLISF
jgi:hypothetical protein